MDSETTRKEALHEKFEEMKRRVKGKYGGMAKPDEKPKFPGSLSKINDDALIDLLGKYAEWQAFAGTEVGEADANRKFYDVQLKNARRRAGKILQDNMELKGTKDVKKFMIENAVEEDPEVNKLEELQSLNEATYRLEQTYKDGFDKFGFVLSRELTRRLKTLDLLIKKERAGTPDDTGQSDDDLDASMEEIFDFEGIGDKE